MSSNLVSDRGAIVVEGEFSDDDNVDSAVEAMNLRNLKRGIARYHSTSTGVETQKHYQRGRGKDGGSESEDSIVFTRARSGADRMHNISDRFDFWNPRPQHRARSVSPRLFPSSVPRHPSPPGMRTAERSARRQAMQSQRKPTVVEDEEKDSEDDMKPTVKRKPDMAARARLYGQTESTNRKASPPLKPHAGKNEIDSDEEGSQPKPKKRKGVSPLGNAAGKRLYSMARVQQNNQQEMRARADALREKELAKSCPFTPKITSMAKHFAEDAYRAPSERYELLKQRQSLNRIDQKVREEERLVKECTFKPSLSRASMEMVRRSRSCDVPQEAGQRLYEEKNERRVRQLLKQRLIESETEKQAIGCFQVTQEEADGIATRLHRWGDMRDKNVVAMREECVRRMRAPHVRGLDPNAVVARLLSPSPEPANAHDRCSEQRERSSSAPPIRSGVATDDGRRCSTSSSRSGRSTELDHRQREVMSCPRISEKSRQIAEELRIIRFGALFYKYAPLDVEEILFSEIKRQVRDLFPEDAGVIAALSHLYKRDGEYVTKEDFVVCLIMYEHQYGPQRWGRPSRENVLHAFHMCLDMQAAEDAAEGNGQARQHGQDGFHSEQQRGGSSACVSPRNADQVVGCSGRLALSHAPSQQATPRGRWCTPLSSARSLRASNVGDSPAKLVSATPQTKRRTLKTINIDFTKDAEKRAERRKQLVEEIRQREVEECTFAPKLNTRTVSLSDRNLQRTHPGFSSRATSSTRNNNNNNNNTQRGHPAAENATTSASGTETYVEPSQSNSSPSKDNVRISREFRASLSAIEVSSDSAAGADESSPRSVDSVSQDGHGDDADKLAELDLLLAIERELAKHTAAARSEKTNEVKAKKAARASGDQRIQEADANVRRSKRGAPSSGSVHRNRMISSTPSTTRAGRGADLSRQPRVRKSKSPAQRNHYGPTAGGHALVMGAHPRFADEADSIFQSIYGSIPLTRDGEEEEIPAIFTSSSGAPSHNTRKVRNSDANRPSARSKETLLLAIEKPIRKKSSSPSHARFSRKASHSRHVASHAGERERESNLRLTQRETHVLVVPRKQSTQHADVPSSSSFPYRRNGGDAIAGKKKEKREEVSGSFW